MSSFGDDPSAGAGGEGPPGPGWWMASDGRWYPPEQAPGAVPPPGAPPSAPPPGAPPFSQPDPAGYAAPATGYGAPNMGQPAPSSGSSVVKILLVIGVVVILMVGVGIAAVTLLGDSEPARDETGAIVEEGTIDVFSLQVGDCFDDTDGISGGEVDALPTIPCDQPHDNEVFYIHRMPDGSYPGQAEISAEAERVCVAEFEPYTGQDYMTSELDVFPLTPTPDSWNLGNDREIVCALYNMDLSKLTGSQRAG